MTPPAVEELDSALAALISAVAEGKPFTALDKAVTRLLLVDRAQAAGATWAAIAAAFGYPSGKQAKKMVHALRSRVKRELMAGGRDG